jgi:hypothetical protein
MNRRQEDTRRLCVYFSIRLVAMSMLFLLTRFSSSSAAFHVGLSSSEQCLIRGVKDLIDPLGYYVCSQNHRRGLVGGGVHCWGAVTQSRSASGWAIAFSDWIDTSLLKDKQKHILCLWSKCTGLCVWTRYVALVNT